MQFVWLYIDDLVGKGLEMSILAQLFFYTSITFVPMALPLAILLASLMCFGNFGEHYELVAMKASGISIWRVMRPLVFFSLLMSGVAFLFSNSIMPVATLKSKTLLWDVRKQKLAFDIKEGVFYKDIENYVIYVNKKGKDGSSIYGVKIYDHTDREGNTKMMTADSGYMMLSPNQRNIFFTLYNGYNYTDLTNDKNFKKKRPFERMKFKEERIKFGLQDFDMTRTNENLFKTHQQMMNIRQLSTSLDSLYIRYDEKEKSYTESFKRRFANFNNLNITKEKLHVQGDELKKTEDSTSILKWPLLENLDRSERAAVADMAVGSAKNAKENATFTKNDFNGQMENIRKHQKEWHKKFSLSIACLIFFFIGAPLGTIIRKGGLGFPTVISLIFFVIYWVTSMTAERMAIVGKLSMFFGMWASSLLLFPIGIFLTFKATSDSALFDSDSWKKGIKKLVKRFSKSK
jgi:Predicted permeases